MNLSGEVSQLRGRKSGRPPLDSGAAGLEKKSVSTSVRGWLGGKCVLVKSACAQGKRKRPASTTRQPGRKKFQGAVIPLGESPFHDKKGRTSPHRGRGRGNGQ